MNISLYIYAHILDGKNGGCFFHPIALSWKSWLDSERQDEHLDPQKLWRAARGLGVAATGVLSESRNVAT